MPDASIYNNVGRFKSIRDYDNEAAADKLNQLRLMSAQSEYDQGQASIRDQNALRALTLTGNDDADYAAMRRISPAAAAAHQKAQLEARKVKGDIGKTEAETKKVGVETDAKKLDSSIKAHDYHVQLLGALAGPQDIPAWVDAGVKAGVFTPEQGQAGLVRAQQMLAQPGGFDVWRKTALQGGMNATEQLKQQLAEQKFAEDKRQFGVTSTETQRAHKANEGIAIRGQDKVDARSRESTAATMTRPFEVTGPDGQPILVQQDKQGNIAPVQGYGPKTGSSKPLTDSQSKALGFGTRMQESDKIINEIGDDFSPMGINAKNAAGHLPLIGGIAEMGANKALSDNSQRAEQAQRDFVNAVLRRESGAAVSPSEFDNARKQYFPQPGDSAAVKTQKAANRKLAMEGVLAEVPKGQRGSIDPKTAGPKAGIVEGGYRFKGGDPANKDNWEKV
jgi:hypothetical protein